MPLLFLNIQVEISHILWTLQLFKNRNEAQGKLRMNLHLLSESVSELLEYRRKVIKPTQYDYHICFIFRCNKMKLISMKAIILNTLPL